MKRICTGSICGTLWLSTLIGRILPAEDGITVWQGVYSEAQAGRGSEQYSKCAACHGTKLEGQGAAVGLKGPAFLMNWEGRSVQDLVTRISTTMPQDDPGSLSEQEVVDLVAFMFKANGFPSADSELQAGSERLRAIRIVSKRP